MLGPRVEDSLQDIWLIASWQGRQRSLGQKDHVLKHALRAVLGGGEGTVGVLEQVEGLELQWHGFAIDGEGALV